MLHEFLKNDTEKDFIQAIINNSILPVYETIRDFDYVVSGGTYIYKKSIIKCTKSGIFKDRGSNSNSNAAYEIIGEYDSDQVQPNISKINKCNCAYYDSQTHALLGDYLRWMRDIQGINLMQLYNCFGYEILDNYEIIGSRCIFNPNSNYKILSVPIKFNRTYSIGIDCQSGGKILPILWGQRGLLTSTSDPNIYFGDRFEKVLKPQSFGTSSINRPITIYVDTSTLNESEEFELYSMRKYLRLFIQVPKTNKSSCSVIEGFFPDRYKCYAKRFPFIPPEYTNLSLDTILYTWPELLQMNDSTVYAYSEKLIQYLLQNVITTNETIQYNIKYFQDLLRDKLIKYSDNDKPRINPDILPQLRITPEGQLVLDNENNIVSSFYFGEDDNQSMLGPKYSNRILSAMFELTKLANSDDYEEAVYADFDISKSYINWTPDIWDNVLRFISYNLYISDYKNMNVDVLGYIDTDMERYLNYSKNSNTFEG